MMIYGLFLCSPSLVVLAAELLIHVSLLGVGPPRVSKPGIYVRTRVTRGHVSHHIHVTLLVGQ